MDKPVNNNPENSMPPVGCILVNYKSPWDMLRRCLSSIISSAGGIGLSVILVDNASEDGPTLDLVRKNFPEVRIVEMPGNYGFAAGVNRGLEEVAEPYVLLLNTDAILKPDSLRLMLLGLNIAGSEVAGVAPKMILSSYPGILDAVGTVMPPTGASFNRGIGQCDLGQYDREEDVFGVCFGAALLRRELFDAGSVGPLYEKYFLYFEDSDWCMRARSRGYRFVTSPEATVLHLHSGTARHESLAFKYKLIELNTLKLVVRNFESARLTAKVAAARCLRLIARTVIRRRYIAANLSTLGSFLVSLPSLLRERRKLKSLRVTTDSEVFRLAGGEDAFFDTIDYKPDRILDSLTATYDRLHRLKKHRGADAILSSLGKIKKMHREGATLEALEVELKIFVDQPECVQKLLRYALDLPLPDNLAEAG